jgi:DNA-directed RNA polymerase specialized sigma24 family protein
MTSSQAGDVLDIPEGTVRTRLFHARIRLKAILADEVTP